MAQGKARKMTSWRRVALAAWDAPRDPTAYGTLDLDVERALDYVARLRAQSGAKVTLTHLVGKAVGAAIAACPEVNAYVARGEIVVRETVDVFFQVAFAEGGQGGGAKGLAGIKVASVDQKSLLTVARELTESAGSLRATGTSKGSAKGAEVLARLPKPLVGAAARAGAYLSYDLGLDLSGVGIPYDAFGSCMVSNVGVFGIPAGYAPLLDMSRVPLVLTVGAVRDAARVVAGACVPRRSVTIGVAFDHRVLDGYHAGKLAELFTRALDQPEALFGADGEA
jgi:pyruvate dehydrogenase E2 component (dihydrolipoamide acetyltransferase)